MDFEATRKLYSDVIEKPALTDKLLSRPPFKFLLDIFTNSISATGYLRDSFPPSSLDESNFGDKDGKVGFLERIIAAANTDGSLNDVKAGKIVAGKEPELTLKLLQKFAQEARQHRDGSAGSNKENKKKSSSKEKKESSKSSSKSADKTSEKSPTKDAEKKSKTRDKSKEPEPKEKEKDKTRSKSKERDSKSKTKEADKKPDKERSKSKEKSSTKDKEKKSSRSDKEKKEKSAKKPKMEEQVPASRRGSVARVPEPGPAFEHVEQETHLDSHDEEQSATAKTEDSGFGTEMDRTISPRPPPPELREQTRIGTSMGRPQTSMGRPGTAAARAAPPKLKKKQILEIEEKPQVVEPKTEIFTETPAANQVEEDFLVEEEEPRPEVAKEEFDPNAEHGGLVTRIMETREQLDDGQGRMEHDDIDDGEMARQRSHVENLQKNLQRVTQTAFPLAKLFDFAQEDLDSMMKELEKWRNETKKNEQELKEREALGHSEAHKFVAQLAQLEDALRETRQSLQNTKGKMNSNEEQLKIMLGSM